MNECSAASAVLIFLKQFLKEYFYIKKEKYLQAAMNEWEVQLHQHQDEDIYIYIWALVYLLFNRQI